MKRRDLLKGAGVLVLGAPAVSASALLKSNAEPTLQAQTKDLVVTFAGPFCFWQGIPGGSQDCKCITVMAPPVGPLVPEVPHQPWVGTTTNETQINVAPGTTLSLAIDGYSSPPAPTQSGTKSFAYEQGPGTGVVPLFNLTVPIPDIVIGVNPTEVMMVCAPGVTDPYCTQYSIYASGLAFVYKNAPLDGVKIKNGSGDFFKPCFFNDADLRDATLGVHLSPLERRPDKEHKHAKLVWEKMLTMYPWMQKEITGIDFCPSFDPAACDHPQCVTPSVKPGHKKGAPVHHQDPLLFGTGSDCEVPIMTLGPPGPIQKSKKPY